MSRYSTLEIHKEELSFSAGHFTIFSATDREHLHGHNYQVSVAFNVEIGANGLSFDYRYYRSKLQQLCDELDRHFLLPAHSPHLNIIEEDDYYYVVFDHKKIPFLKDDVMILPIANTTIEEISYWFLKKLIADTEQLTKHAIAGITLKVFNGPGQSAGATWGQT